LGIHYPREFDLRLNGMICVRIDSAQHCPVDAASRGTAVEECWCSRVDSQVPSRELCLVSRHSRSTRSWVTYVVISDILWVRRHDATVEATFAVLLQVFVRDARVAIFGANDRMVTRPELEGDDVTGKGVDAVWRKVVCCVADFDRVYSDFALLDRESSRVDGSRCTFDVLSRCDAR
jgi:hypothetical protein